MIPAEPTRFASVGGTSARKICSRHTRPSMPLSLTCPNSRPGTSRQETPGRFGGKSDRESPHIGPVRRETRVTAKRNQRLGHNLPAIVRGGDSETRLVFFLQVRCVQQLQESRCRCLFISWRHQPAQPPAAYLFTQHVSACG